MAEENVLVTGREIVKRQTKQINGELRSKRGWLGRISQGYHLAQSYSTVRCPLFFLIFIYFVFPVNYLCISCTISLTCSLCPHGPRQILLNHWQVN